MTKRAVSTMLTLIRSTRGSGGMVRRAFLLMGFLLFTWGCLDSGVECTYSCTQDQAVYQDGVSECTNAAWAQCECLCP